MHNLIRHFPPTSPTTNARHERLIGEVIRAMARLGHPSIRFQIRDDRQVLSFRATNHPTITALHVILEQGARGTVFSEPKLGSQLQLHIVAEQQQTLTRPEALLDVARAQHQASCTYGDVQVSQEHASMLASKRMDVPPGGSAPTGSSPADTLSSMVAHTVDALADALEAHANAERA